MRCFTLLFTIITLLAFNAHAENPLLQWDPGKYGSIRTENGHRILTIKVTPQDLAANPDTQLAATAKIDFRKFPIGSLNFSILTSGKNVSVPKHKYNGVKFMFHYVDALGQQHWHCITETWGTFEKKKVSFPALVPEGCISGSLMLGLQESSGTVEFDLDSLELKQLFRRSSEPFTAVYTPRVTQEKRLRGVMSPQRDMTENDLETLKKWNVNLIRFQICRDWGKKGKNRDLADYDRWLDSRLDNAAWLLKKAPKYGFKLVIDLHTPSGGRDKNNDLAMFYEKKYADHFIACWKKIARRFKGNPYIWGYDLVNEPQQSQTGITDYWTIQKRAAEEIRLIDPEIPIFIAPDLGGGIDGFHYLNPLPMQNIIYEVHMYVPMLYTHQKYNAPKAVSYPGKIGTCFWNKETLRKALKPVRDFEKRYGAKIYVGEFSAIAWAPGAGQYLKDCIELFEEFSWNWSFHAFREYEGWSVEHEADAHNHPVPSAGNDRKSTLLKGFLKNGQ